MILITHFCMDVTHVDIRRELEKRADPRRAETLARFFKTGKGEYGEGDVFLGITVPEQRKVARIYWDTTLPEVRKLLQCREHECRLTALLILVEQYIKGDMAEKERVVKFYLRNKKQVNNWDLVDLSANHILGNYLLGRNTAILATLARSKSVWDRRIAVLATLAFIREKRFREIFRVARMLVTDEHDLIHKAVGWMLREVGKRDMAAEVAFLDRYHRKMPRTMLRYATERFPVNIRKQYLR